MATTLTHYPIEAKEKRNDCRKIFYNNINTKINSKKRFPNSQNNHLRQVIDLTEIFFTTISHEIIRRR